MAGIDNNTLFYLRGDSLKDLSLNPRNITNNNVTLQNNSYTFSNSSTSSTLSYVQVQNSDNFIPQYGDFCVEFKFKILTNVQGCLFNSNTKAGTLASNSRLFVEYKTDGKLYIYYHLTNGQVLKTFSININQLYHIEISRKGDSFYIFIDGKLLDTYVSSSSFLSIVDNVYLGASPNRTYQSTNMDIYNMRISNVARHTEDFTPPTQIFNSIDINITNQTETNVNFNVTKLGQEVINKVEVLVNSKLSKTYLEEFNNIDYLIDKLLCNFGNNEIKIKVTFDDNYTEEKILTHIIDFPQLPSISTETALLDTLNNIKEATKLTEIEKNYLKNVLDSKGVDVTNINKLSILISKVNELQDKKPLIYGIDIDETNSNPSTCVTYTDDAVGFTPLFCGNGTLDYGSWKDTFVIQGNKPCVLKNGVVQYYLNPNDYSKKENGEASDITSGNGGDVMAEFKKCYYKLWKEGDIVKFRVSPVKVDDSYCCNAFLSEDGNATEKDCMYMSTYEAYSDGSKMRSLSGKAPWVNHTIGTARTQATANGSGYQQLTLSKYTFITMLSTLVTKSLNSQSVLGQGRISATSSINTGTMNTKGQFWGDQTGTNGVKLFHIENLYGNLWTFMDGLGVLSSRVSKHKITSPYSDDYSNYSNGYTIPSSDGFVSKINCDNNNGIIPVSVSGSATTYYCDCLYQYSNTNIAIFGGTWDNTTKCGLFFFNLGAQSTYSHTSIGSRLTYS